jgi:RHS repeat-associated protein
MLYCKLIILQIVKQKAPFLLPAEFFYGTLDEITGNIRTFVLPNENETYTFVMDLEHLSSYTSATPQGYTKHYYAGTERVVSKIGCGGLKEITSPIEELEGAFTPIPEKRDMLYGQLDRTVHECLGRESEIIWDNLKYLRELEGLQCEEEQELYFYHPDHLGSTGMVTDNSSNITQGFLYAPFGEIITEFNPSWESGRIPKYSFNAKELDEENGMYYYSARYYAPPTFISRDVLFEEKPWMSPYSYCSNSPVNRIDPTGMNDWEPDGQGGWIAEKGDNAWTLHKDANISYDKAKSLMKEQGFKFSKDDKHVQVQVGDKVQVEDNSTATNDMPIPYRQPASGRIDYSFPNVEDFIILGSAVKGLFSAASKAITKFTAKESANWVYGSFKSEAKWASQMAKRGWTEKQITQAIKSGKPYDAINYVNKANSATRYVHPTT